MGARMSDDEYPADSITGWIRAMDPNDSEKYRPAVDQAMFLRDAIHPLIERKYEDRRTNHPMIIGWHNSKSCKLPVIKFETAAGVKLVVRGNFYNWKASVEAPKNVPFVFYDLFNPEDRTSILPCYCEGFPMRWVFGSYADDPAQFTAETPGTPMNPDFTNGLLFTFCFLLGRAIRS